MRTSSFRALAFLAAQSLGIGLVACSSSTTTKPPSDAVLVADAPPDATMTSGDAPPSAGDAPGADAPPSGDLVPSDAMALKDATAPGDLAPLKDGTGPDLLPPADLAVIDVRNRDVASADQAARDSGVDLPRACLADGAYGPACNDDPYSGEWAGVVAAYSLIHVPHERLVEVLGRLARAIEPGAPVLASFHLGQGMIHSEAMFDIPVDLDFFLYSTDEATAAFRHAGFEVCEALERGPYPEVEYQGRRVYLLARKPESA